MKKLFLTAITLFMTTCLVANDSIVVKGKFTGNVSGMNDEMVPLLFSFFKGDLDIYPGKTYHGNGPFFREFRVDSILAGDASHEWAGMCFNPRYRKVICINEANLYGEEVDIFTLHRFPESDDLYYIKDFTPRNEKDQSKLERYQKDFKRNIDIIKGTYNSPDYQYIKDLLGDFPSGNNRIIDRYDYRYIPYLIKYINSDRTVTNKIYWSSGEPTEEYKSLSHYIKEYIQYKFLIWHEDDIKSFYDSLMIRPLQLPRFDLIGQNPVVLTDSVWYYSDKYLSLDKDNNYAYFTGEFNDRSSDERTHIYYYADLQKRTFNEIFSYSYSSPAKPRYSKNNCIIEAKDKGKLFNVKKYDIQNGLLADSVSFTIKDIPIMEVFRNRNPETLVMPFGDNFLIAWARDSKTTDSIAINICDSTGKWIGEAKTLFSMDGNNPGFISIDDVNIVSPDSEDIFVSFTHKKPLNYNRNIKSTYIYKLDSSLNTLNKYTFDPDTLRDIYSDLNTTIKLSDSLFFIVREVKGKINYEILDKDLQLISQNSITPEHSYKKLRVTPCVGEKLTITWVEKLPYKGVLKTAFVNKDGSYTIKDIFDIEDLYMQIFTVSVNDDIDYYLTQEKYNKTYLFRKTISLSEFR